MNKFFGCNEVFNFYPHFNEGLISLDINTASKLLKSKLENIKATQNHPHLSKMSELIKEKDVLHLKKMKFSEHEISDLVDNLEKHLLSIKQCIESEQHEINLISKRLNELEMLMSLKKQINVMENYCLQTVLNENKIYFYFI